MLKGHRDGFLRQSCRRWGVVSAAAAVATMTGISMLRLSAEDAPRGQGEPAQVVEVPFVVAPALSRSGKRAWGPEQMVGPPDVAAAGDNPLAWASISPDGQPEWVILEFKSAARARSFAVYETCAPGALVKLSVFDPAGKEVVAWEGKDPTPQSSPKGISLIPVRLDFPVRRIKLFLDSEAVPNWNEIDAVQLEDVDGNTQWVANAEASSTYANVGMGDGTRPYGAEQATGEPNIFNPGDQSFAWTSATPDGQAEWLTLRFEKPQNPAEIVVHENTAPGAITKIGVFDSEGKETVAWEGIDPTPRTEPWGVSVFPVKLAFPVGKVKLYIDSVAVPGYNEIDAVGLRSAKGETQWAKSATASSSFGAGFGNQVMVAPERDPQLQELVDEVQRLRKQVDELQKTKADLDKLKELLKDKLK